MLEDVPRPGRPRVSTRPQRYRTAHINMLDDLYSIALEYCHETGQPLSRFVRVLVVNELRKVGKIE